MIVVPIEHWRDTCKGEVALLGSGESVNNVDLEWVQERMPVIGMNRSLLRLKTTYHVINHPTKPLVEPIIDMFDDGNPHVIFYPVPQDKRLNHLAQLCENQRRWLVPINRLPFAKDGVLEGFHGWSLNYGSQRRFAGALALEVAVWLGFTSIWLIGYDCAGGHFFDPSFRPGNDGVYKEKGVLTDRWQGWLDAHIPTCWGRGVEVRYWEEGETP